MGTLTNNRGKCQQVMEWKVGMEELEEKAGAVWPTEVISSNGQRQQAIHMKEATATYPTMAKMGTTITNING